MRVLNPAASRRPAKRPAFTMVEVLVVISIIGILIALILPAVQAAREAGRRAQCVNNLRQIGLAINNYVSVCGAFPPGGEIYRQQFSFLAMILPYIEQKPLYDSLNFSTGPYFSAENHTAEAIGVAAYLCPTDSGPTYNTGWTNYAGNFGTGYLKFGANGAFVLEGLRGVTPAEFLDGTSSTVAVSEWLRGLARMDARDERRSIFQFPEQVDEPGEFDQFVQACKGLDITLVPQKDVVNDRGRSWDFGSTLGTLYHHILNINERSCHNGHDSLTGAISAGSLHPGGANSLFADGHVRFLRETMAPRIWRAIGSRNGGEILSEGEY